VLVRSEIDECLDGLECRLARSHVQRRVIRVHGRESVEVGVGVAERVHHVAVVLHGPQLQCRVAPLAARARIDVGAVSQENLDRLLMAAEGRRTEQAHAVGALDLVDGIVAATVDHSSQLQLRQQDLEGPRGAE